MTLTAGFTSTLSWGGTRHTATHTMLPASELHCRAMTHADLPSVLALQHACYHPDFHEPMVAFSSKLQAAPDSCWVIGAQPLALAAYLVCLPVQQGHYPLLHADRWQAPVRADELYLHDMAISPSLRGRGAARLLLRAAVRHARDLEACRLSLIAVQGSQSFWSHLGFNSLPVDSPALRQKLASFGPDATLMSQTLTNLDG